MQRLRELLVGTLRRQLVVGMVLVVALMMSLFVLDISWRQQAVVTQQQQQQVIALTRSVATASAVWVAARDLSGVQEIVDGFAAYPDLHYAMVLDVHGQILAHSDRSRLGLYLTDLPAKPEVQVLPRGPLVVDAFAPVRVAQQHVGWARLGLSHESQQATLARVARSGAVYAVLAMGLSALLAWFSGRYMTRRLHAIEQVADAVQAGHKSLRAQVPGHDEAARLARQFNAMLDTLAQHERALAQALSRLQAMTNCVPGVVVLQLRLSADGRLSVPYASEVLQDIFQVSPQAVRDDASALLAVIHPDDLATQQAAMASSAHTLHAWLGEMRLQRADQPPGWVQINAMPRPEPGGSVLWHGFITDITELKRAQSALHASQDHLRSVVTQLEARNADLKELNDKLQQSQWQLLQSEKMASIGQLAAGVAHEINNPIGFVQSNLGSLERYLAQLLEVLEVYQQGEALLRQQLRAGNPPALTDASTASTAPTAPTAPEPAVAAWLAQLDQARARAELDYLKEDIPLLLKETREGVVRVRQIVINLRDFSRADSHEQWTWSDLRNGLDSTLNIVFNEIKYRADVVKDYGELPAIKCLPSQLNQVFLNLLVNAAQAMTEGVRGTITVRCGAQPGGVWVEIADNGTGIAAPDLQRIFEPFFTTKPVGKGTGLGLSLSFGIVQKHGGQIEVQSTPGEGTCFRITLPIEPPETPESSAKAHDD